VGLSGKVLAALPVADVSGSAKLNGQEVERDVLASAIRCSVCPSTSSAPRPLDGRIRDVPPGVIVGASLQVTAPLGQYDSTKLLNVGTNRWSIKPELGVSKAWGPVTLEVIPASPSSRTMTISSAENPRAGPIYSVQGHLIYEISPALWTAFDATYYTGGRTTIDGEKGERLENVRLGLTTSLS